MKNNTSAKIMTRLIESTNEPTLTNDDLMKWNYYKVGDDTFVEFHWADNQDVYEDDIEDGENIDDYWAIYYNVFDSKGNEVGGGESIVKEDTPTFIVRELIQDNFGLGNGTITKISEDEMPKPSEEPEEPTETHIDDSAIIIVSPEILFVQDSSDGGLDYTRYSHEGAEIDGGQIDDMSLENSVEEIIKAIYGEDKKFKVTNFTDVEEWFN